MSFGTADQIAACDYVGIVSLGDTPDKMETAGFTVTRSERVNAPVIDQLPVAVECKVVDITEEYGETRVVGEIVGMVADEAVLTGGKVDFAKLRPVVFDSAGMCYREVGPSVGGAWGVGKSLMPPEQPRRAP